MGLTGKIAAGVAVIFLAVAMVSGFVNHSGMLDADVRVWVFSFLMQPLGYAAGGLVSWAFGMDCTNIMTISIETGVQNFALAMAIVSLSIDEDDDRFEDAFIIPALCSGLYAVHCLWIVLLFRKFRPPAPAEEGPS